MTGLEKMVSGEETDSNLHDRPRRCMGEMAFLPCVSGAFGHAPFF